MSRQLVLRLLGPPDVRLDTRPIAFPTRKTLALLIYLAVEGIDGGEQPREHLAALLWPESSPERAHASLRNTLNHLQTALRDAGDPDSPAFLAVTHPALALNPDAPIDLDLQTVARAYVMARGDRASRAPAQSSAGLPVLQAAAACYRGDFLAGLSLGDAPGFDDWAAAQREVWRRRLGLVLDRLSELQFAGGEFAGTAETAARWIALDALNEVAYRRKMRAHFAAGERGQALEAYDACRAALAAELQVQPEPDTEALAAHIRAQQARTPSPEPQLPDTPAAFLENLFIGRGAEHQALAERFAQAAAGRPQVVLLRGEAGIGKTRLARAFLAWAAAQGAETLAGRAFESGSRMPYQPLIEAVGPLIEKEDRLHDLLGETWLAPLSHLLPALRARHPELPAAPLEAPAGRTPLFEALVRLTLALAERAPLVLFVDDLQWTDSATLDLLQYAARRWRELSAPIMLLASVRADALRTLAPPGSASLPRWLERVQREVEPYHLELEPLPERETVRTVASLLVPPAPDFAQWVCQETRGHPFYLIETLKDLLERGALHPRRRPGGPWGFAVDAEHDLGQAVRVPATVRVVIRSRLDRLSPAASTLLAAGAVLERRLTFEHLCAVSHVAEDRALAAIDELVSGRLMSEEVQPGAASHYRFANDMLRDVVYTEAGDARRRLFHRRALKVLAAAADSQAVLAHHALAAGLAGPAFRHSLAAGEEALRLAAAGDAVAHFEKARQLAHEELPDGADVAPHLRDLYRQLARAYEFTGQHEQAQAVQAEWERHEGEPPVTPRE